MKHVMFAIFVFVSLSFNINSITAQESVEMIGVTDLSWNADGTILAVAGFTSEKGIIQLFDANGQFLREWDAIADTITLSPLGDKLASTMAGGAYAIWDTNTGEIMTYFTWSTMPSTSTTNDLSIYWTSDGENVIVIGGFFAEMHNAQTGELVSTYGNSSTDDLVPRDQIGYTAWDIDRNQISISKADYSIEVWDAITGEQISEYQHSSFVVELGLNANGTQLAFASDDLTLYILDIQALSIVNTLTGLNGLPRNIEWSPDSTLIAISNAVSRPIDIWGVEMGQILETFVVADNAFVTSLNFTPFGGQLVFGAYARGDVLQIVETTIPFDQIGGAQLFVPAPSLERLQTIAESCGAMSLLEQSIGGDITDAALPSIITQLQAATADQIPPACAADLIAIAEAIQSQ
mgnify:CR=1 FL=1